MASLLTIPTEVRLLVLEHLLVSPFISEETGNPEVWPYLRDAVLATRTEGLHLLYPQVLRTCKKIYVEGIKLLYSKNRICIYPPSIAASDVDVGSDCLSQALRFLRGIGKNNSSLVRRLTIGGGSGLLQTEHLKECFQLATGLGDLRLLTLGPRCKAPYSFMLQYYLNVQAASKASSTALTLISSSVPNGFVPEGFGFIYLRFQQEGSRLDGDVRVGLDDSIVYFREKVREQEREWAKQGWNLPVMFESNHGIVSFV
ncbi:hypothetical protein TWF694_008588 [Orbilia ellipsospora]|uniref:F-box domain-containing protein n=1 Tax=Orbilia ellipsospora TaxID=2528407 RepID=A0AAV9XI38_9PEZI